MNILQKADEIVNQRKEEKEREYGPFSESMELAASYASDFTKKAITGKDMYLIMVALKLSRMAYNIKEDTLLDACAYLGALNNYVNNK